MKKKKNTVSHAICNLVKFCIDRPSFNKKNMGSVKEIMKAFFENNIYENCQKIYKEIVENCNKDNQQKGENIFLSGNYNSPINYTTINIALYQDLEFLFNLKKDFNFGSHLFKDYVFNIKGESFNRITNLINSLSGEFLLGIRITIKDYHIYAIVKNDDKWYFKDTTQECKELSLDEVLIYVKRC